MLMKLATSGYKNWGVLSNHMPGESRTRAIIPLSDHDSFVMQRTIDGVFREPIDCLQQGAWPIALALCCG